MTQKPLTGRVILDCSANLPGPFVGKLLLEMGARVLKIENPEKPDGARALRSYYDDLNSRKELVWLNLKKDEDQARFHELVRSADGLIEGFRPDAKRRLGLDEKSLHAINPRLCITSLIGYPEDGPWRDRAGHDLNFMAVTGALSFFKETPGLPLADLFTAYAGAMHMSAMLDSANRTGKGLRTAVGMSETLTQMQSMWIHDYRETGREPIHGETLMTGEHPCYGIYLTRDRNRVSVGAIEEKFWQKLCGLLGLTGLEGKGMSTGDEASQIRAQLTAAFASKTWIEWAPLFEVADCCVEVERGYPELY